MKEKPLTEKRIREIVREEIAKIPPTYIPVPNPLPTSLIQCQQHHINLGVLHNLRI